MTDGFANGDFEYADTSGWTETKSGYGTRTNAITVDADSLHSGSYGCHILNTASGISSYANSRLLSDYFRVSDFDYISIWYKVKACTSGNEARCTIFAYVTTHDGFCALDLIGANGTPGDWVHITVDKDDIMLDPGDYFDEWSQLQIGAVVNGTSGTASLEVYFDDCDAKTYAVDKILFVDDDANYMDDTYESEIEESTGGNTTQFPDSYIAVIPDQIFDDDNNLIRNTLGVVGVRTQDGTLKTINNFPLESPGYYIINSGWVIDFAQDLSQPEPISTWRVNKDIFDWDSNDDKRKLSTQVTVRGKDALGQSISVSLNGLRKFDEDRKFFNQCTFVSRKSEGYIYKNSYATDLIKDCEGVVGTTVTYHVDYPGGDKTKITVGTGGFIVGNLCAFTNPPAPLVDGTAYYIVYHSGSDIKVSSTYGGSAISLKSWTSKYGITWGYSSCPVTGTAHALIKGEVINVSLLSTDDDHAVTTKVAAACNGYVDADGITWTAEVVDLPYANVRFTSAYEGLGDAPISWDDNGTSCTASFDHSEWVAWGATLNASDVSVIQVDNLDGWFTFGMSLQFSGTTLPAGLSADTVYTVGSTPAVSATAIFMVKEGGSIVSFTTTGTDVICFKPNSVRNLDENGSSCIWLYGWDYGIRDGDDIGVSIPGDTLVELVVSGEPIETIDINGVMVTTIGINTIPQLDYGGGHGFLLNERIYVNDISQVTDGEDYTIGEERALVSTIETDVEFGDYITIDVSERCTSDTNKCYPHGVGALVMRLEDNPNYPYYYDTSYPEVDSPMYLHGSKIADVTVDNNVTYGYLDAYATSLLLGQGQLWKKATCIAAFNSCLIKRVGVGVVGGDEYDNEENNLTFPRVGDTVRILQSYDETTGTVWEIMSVNIDYDKGTVKLVLGDFEMNPITSMIKATNGINRPIT
jgi:hypothetical protein